MGLKKYYTILHYLYYICIYLCLLVFFKADQAHLWHKFEQIIVFFEKTKTPPLSLQWAKIKKHNTIIILIFENLQIGEQIQ